MKLTVFQMEREPDDHGLGMMYPNLLPLRLSSPPTNARNFGFSRHGFNNPSSFGRSNQYQPATQTTREFTSGNGNMLPGVWSFDGLPRAAEDSFARPNGFSADFPAADRVRNVSDCTMPTSSPRRPSQDGNGEASIEEQQANSPTHHCSCPDDSKRRRLSTSASNLNLATNAFHAARQFPRLSVYDLLNHSPISPQTDNRGEIINRGSISPVHGQGNQKFRVLASPASSSSSSSSNIRPAFSIPEEPYTLFDTLYHTCLEASSFYIKSLFPSPRRHRHHMREYRARQSRFHPYRRDSSVVGLARPTLMDNISKICNYTWRKARNDLMAPNREEAEAVKVMRDLYTGGEVVVRGVDGNGSEDGSSDSDSVFGHIGMVESERVGEAAKKFCDWLRDRDAWRDCQRVVGELKTLVSRERESGEIVSISDDSEDGLCGIV